MSVTRGQFRLAASGLGWKSPTGQVFTIRREDLRKTQWLRAARGYQLRIQLKDGTIVKFDGFQEDAFERLKGSIKHNYHLPLELKELCLKGWNWGKTEFNGNYLQFNVANRQTFEVPLSEVSNSNVSGKSEVSIELALNEGPGTSKEKRERARRRGDQLMEVRFFVPGMVQADDGEGDEEQSAAQLFYETVKTKAELGQVAGEYVVRFHDVFSLSPRARFEVEFFPTFLRMRGKTYDYKILYDTITRMFLVPRPDDIHVYFVIGIDPPIRQGQTRYPFLVFQFLKEEEIDVTLNMDEQELAKYEGKLESSYHNFTYVIVSTILRALTDKKITVPGNSFNSHHNQKGVKCSLKANEGFIYPLENYLLFLPKPVTLIPLRDITTVVFSRVGSAITSSRFFDVKINTRSGTSHQFSNLNREEYTNFLEYLNTKGVSVRKDQPEEITSYAGMDGADSSSEDEGATPRKRIRGADDDEDEDEESADEDFVIEDSGSDVPEEFDEEYEGADSSENEGAPASGAAADSD
ncbi:structure-specific recognition protein-domain-containing protein [Syncephalis fuscata]|nr:structure-specific recognition protein-domain-containing protein [Syncephalis fuscata]